MWNDSVIEALRLAPDEFLNLGVAGLGTFDVSTREKRRSAIDLILRTLKRRSPDERATNA
jgi:hypothetical protein